ncbi:MAG: tetratricopeptide repeat protein [Pseudanabaenaceae cyanobacterium SKYGB_i_bin29]|nr:tetratricopeptide repeat protein [Pseudanabaenaceae cyanobacterium SKYG29]MDW8422090.1 tetratricopeptide repeat protein [Pseudanabaenaceae cyanobacterium SKYGB_i_bin29]
MKTIVLCLSQPDQVDLWQRAFATQPNIRLTVVPAAAELLDYLEPLPDLILLDLGIKATDGTTLQASNVGRCLKSKGVTNRLVLINLKEEGQIKDLEKRWALRQGAVEVLPRLTPVNLLAHMDIIAHLLQMDIDRTALQPLATTAKVDTDISSFGSLDSAADYYDRAQTRLQQNNYSGALYDIQKAIELDNEKANYYSLRAQILFQQGIVDQALLDLDVALKIDPQYKEAYYYKGIIRSSLGENKVAVMEFDRAIKIDNRYSAAYNARGLAKFQTGDERGALQDYNYALKIDPNLASAYNNRGLLLQAQGNSKNAIQDFTKAIEVDPTFADAYYNRGNVYSDSGEFAKAIADYTEAIKYKPNFPQAYGNRGLAYYEMDNIRQALLDTQEAAKLFQQQGDMEGYQQALETYKQMKS